MHQRMPTVTVDFTAMYSDGAGLIRMQWRSTPCAPMFSRNGTWTANLGVSRGPPQPGARRQVWTSIAVPPDGNRAEPYPIA